MKKNKIILEAETELQDNQLRAAFRGMEKKLERVNERSKLQTLDIRDLKKRIAIMEVKK